MSVVPVVLSGGAGTRLWPLSTPERPKPLHALVGDEPMLVETIRRLEGLDTARPIVVCGAAHADGVQGVLAGIDAEVVVEPVGRNTAPAIALAAQRREPDDVLLVLPADHVIKDAEAFREAAVTATQLAADGHLVTFGIVATRPATGYGWIEPGADLGAAHRVASFREKPDEATAATYLASGWLWNSGMFCFTAGAFLEELERHRPDVASAVAEGVGAYHRVPSVSVDYAVMEPTDRAVVVPLEAGWSDVGSWESLWEVLDRDDNGNAVVGEAFLKDTTGCLVVAEHHRIAVIDQHDTVIISAEHGTVVVPLTSSERVKQAAETFTKPN